MNRHTWTIALVSFTAGAIIGGTALACAWVEVSA
jgi:hypothetical protein